MINLLSQVTPTTKGLIWLTNEALGVELSFYKDVDYLLNGLLTSTLNSANSRSCHVLVGENFGETFYVLVGKTEAEAEIRSYFELIKPQLLEGSHLLLIDESKSFSKIQKIIPAEVKAKILSLT